MTKLSPDAEWIIRQLNEVDEADDPEMTWSLRKHTQRRVLAVLSVRRDVSEMREMAAFRALHRRRGLLEHFAPLKRKPGERHHKPNPLGYAVDDVRRIRDILERSGKQLRDKETPQLIAAERHLRIVYGRWPEGELDHFDDDPEEAKWQAELREVENKLYSRLKGSGPTGAERNRKLKHRAK